MERPPEICLPLLIIFTSNHPKFSLRRLQDTREAAIFINEINKYIWDNNIEDKPIIFALDVENFFPSVKLQLALPAIKQALKQNNITNNEINDILFTIAHSSYIVGLKHQSRLV